MIASVMAVVVASPPRSGVNQRGSGAFFDREANPARRFPATEIVEHLQGWGQQRQQVGTILANHIARSRRGWPHIPGCRRRN